MRTIFWDGEKCCITAIDQTALPSKSVLLDIYDMSTLHDAILALKIRGAPALGAAGGFGVALLAHNIKAHDLDVFVEILRDGAESLKKVRPTAVNLSWGVERIFNRCICGRNIEEIQRLAIKEANALADEDVSQCKAIGAFGADLLKDGDRVLTHCNAGRLACVDWGTALGVIRSAAAAGKNISVISCETRPLNQGSRITCFELMEDQIPVTLITDSMAGYAMRKGMVDKVIVGADRIVEDAVFNKIGTYSLSVLAKEHGIPFYVAAPSSTFDFTLREKDVVVEERDHDELRHWNGAQIAPADVPTLNPAFDATPMENVTAIITEQGIIKPPVSFESLRKKFNISSCICSNPKGEQHGLSL
jgi:methylthioribose-1-phosphate isomerase